MRYLPHTPQERAEMLAAIGAASVDDLFDHVPKVSQLKAPLALPPHQGEREVEAHLTALARRNCAAGDGPFFLGAGAYFHHIPASVDHLIQRSEFLTSYTPYQPEISQGTLAVIFEFQSMIAALTGQEIANASMYDGATSVTEAALMARRITGREHVHIVGELHPHYRETLQTSMDTIGGEIRTGLPGEDAACVIVQIPDFHGEIRTLAELRAACDAVGAKLIVAVTEIVALGLIAAPAEADIVAGEAQSLGVGLQYGGPHVGFFACKQKDVRQMPGRLCGLTTDADGKRSFILTLNTREQHIRREKATSNICTNVGLMATAFTMHLALLGEGGFKQLAVLNHEAAIALADALSAVKGVEVVNQSFFNELVVKLPKDAKVVHAALHKKGIVAGLVLDDAHLLLAATEMTSEADIAAFAQALGEVL
jgi:glycine dehydrogenase subunit 1